MTAMTYRTADINGLRVCYREVGATTAPNLLLHGFPSAGDMFRDLLPLLAVWGQNDPFFLPAGAEAFKHDLPKSEVHLLDTGHFALETHAEAMASAIRTFLGRS
jgi:pimeloyl-ACP methyl ester carboxylesterase